MEKEKKALNELIKQHKVIAIDTPVFIYHFEDHPRYRNLTIPLFESIETGRCNATTSVLTRLEVLVQPLKSGHGELADRYRLVFDTFPNLKQIDINREVADTAASIRSTGSITTPDSLHLACAIHAGCSAFITNDAGLPDIGPLKVITLDFLLRQA